jgi:hypothetical protein
LRADIVALAHALRRVVVFPKRLEQPRVGNFLRVIDHEHDFVVPGAAGTHFFVGRVRGQATGITDRGDVDAVAELPEFPLGAPEATEAEHRHGEPGRVGAFERPAVDEMGPRGRDRRGASGERLLGRGHFQLLAE